MLSCDTFALSGQRCADGRTLFCKNSDRPLGEAQPLCYAPAAHHSTGETLRCTHLTIPQAEQTYAVLGSRPYWIWGFEMGVNEYGLAIGNEAEYSRCAPETEEGLLGMDLLRLGLERARTAREAIDVITGLLTQYGQNANANPRTDRRYENSYLLADPQEIWVLETAGREWAARKMCDHAAISNCYSIGSEYDLSSPSLEERARLAHWLRPDAPFDFARAYTRTGTYQARSMPRWRRLRERIAAITAPVMPADAQSIMRDHFEGALIAPRFGIGADGMATICMHAVDETTSQTAASWCASFHEGLGPVVWYAPSVPCLSAYLPVFWTGEVPEILTAADGHYDSASLWWAVERAAILASIDEERYGEPARKKLHALEAQFVLIAAEAEEKALRLIAADDRPAALRLLSDTTAGCANELFSLAGRIADEIIMDLRACGGLYGMRAPLVSDYARRVGMPLD